MRTIEDLAVAIGGPIFCSPPAIGEHDRARSEVLLRAIDLMSAGDVQHARKLLLYEVRTHDPDNAVAWALLACTARTPFRAVYSLNQLLRLRPGLGWAKTALREITESPESAWRSPAAAPSIDVGFPLDPSHRPHAALLPEQFAARSAARYAGITKLIHNAVAGMLSLLLAASIVLFLAPRLMGSNLLVVQSQSMEPAVPMGAVVVSESVAPSDVDEGDVITFRASSGFGQEGLITHRVIAVDDWGGEVVFKTKGDASEEPDIDLVPGSDLLGKVWFTVPLAGFALAFIRTPLGFAIIVGLPAAFIIAGEVKTVGEILRSGGGSHAHEDPGSLSGVFP